MDEVILELAKYDKRPFHDALEELHIQPEMVLALEAVMITWHFAPVAHPQLDTSEEQAMLTNDELIEWERMYADEQYFGSMVFSALTEDDRKKIAERWQKYRDFRVFGEEACDFLGPTGELHKSLAGRFLRHVILQYMHIHQMTPWADYAKAKERDEYAMIRLLTVDPMAAELPGLKPIRKLVTKNVYHSFSYAKLRRVSRTITEQGDFKGITRKSFASRKISLAVEVQDYLKANGCSLNVPQIRKLFNAFMAGFEFDRDPTLPKTDEALSKAMRRRRKAMSEDRNS